MRDGFLKVAAATPEALCEVEAELKQGAQADTLAFGAYLAEHYGLVPEEKSKLARALALAE